MTRRNIIALSLLALLSLLTVPLNATRWYVSPGGNNANSGSSSSLPWKSLQFACDSSSAQSGDTLELMTGTFVENVQVTKSLTLRAYNSATVTITAPTSSSNSAVVRIAAASVRLIGLIIVANAPYAPVGVVSLNRNNLVIESCSISRTGSGGSFTISGSNFTQTLNSAGIIVCSDDVAPFESASIRATSIGSSTSMFQRGVWLRAVGCVIGGNSNADSNAVYASEADVYVQYAATSTCQVSNNIFHGAGVVVDEPHVFDGSASSSLTLTANQFSPLSSTYSQSLLIRHNYQPNSSVNVNANVFTGHQTGIASYASAHVSLSANTFTAGANNATHIRANSMSSGVTSNVVQNSISILANSFYAGGYSGVRAIELMDDNAGLSSQPTPDFSNVTIGSASSPNTFAQSLSRCLTLSHAFSQNIGLSENLFGVSGASAAAVVALSMSQCFEIEDKIDHAIDAPGLGFVTIHPSQKYITTNSFVSGTTSSASVQRAVDQCSAGDTVFLQQGVYNGAVTISSGIHLVGEELSSGVPVSILNVAGGNLITKSGAQSASLNRLELRINTDASSRWGSIANAPANTGHANANLILFRRGSEPVGGMENPGVQGVDVGANIDDANDYGNSVGTFIISNILGCPQVFNLGASASTLCEEDSIIVQLSGSQSGISYAVVVDGFSVASTQAIQANGTRRFAIASMGSGSYTLRVKATLGTCSVWMNGNVTVTSYTPQTPVLSLNSLNQILCSGSNGLVTIINTDPQSNYAVYDGASVVSNMANGTNGSIVFSISAPHFPASGQKSFSVRATSNANSACANETSSGAPDGATFNVYALPAAPVITTNSPIACTPGGSASVIVVNAEAGFIYQVLDGNTAIFSVTCLQSGVLNIHSIPLSPAVPGLGYGTRTVRVSAINPINNNCRVLSANTLSITVSPKPTLPLVVTGTSTQSYCDTGTGVTAHVYVANGDASMQYSVVDASNQQRATAIGQSGTFAIPVSGLNPQGSVYQLRVVATWSTSGCNSDPSAVTYVSVNATPVASIQLEGSSQSGAIALTVCAGYAESLVLHSTSSLNAVSYQWILNGNAITGATQSDYTIPTGNGVGQYQYRLRQTSAQGCVGESNTCTLTVATGVQLNASGSNSSVSIGFFSGTANTNTLNVVAIPAELGLSYQWRKDGTDVSAATTASFTIPSTLAPGTYQYSARATTTNGCTATSNTVSVEVWSLPVLHINVQANGRQDSSYAMGLAAPSLTSSINGSHGLSASYQWFGPNSNSLAISGATSGTFTPPSSLSPGVYRYVARATLGGVTVLSDTVTLNVLTPATIDISVLPDTRNDSSYYVGVQAPTLGSTLSNGNGITFVYQWYGPNGTGAIAGATSTSYVPSSSLNSGDYRYYLVATGGGQYVVSDTVLLTVIAAPTANAYISPNVNQNDSTTFRSVSTPTFSVLLSGNNGYTVGYQWYGPNNSNPINDATNASYTPPSGLSSGVYRYFSRVSVGGLTIASDTVTLTVLADPSISAYVQPTVLKKEETIIYGQSSATLGSTLTNNASRIPGYQWYNASAASVISGATTATYSVPNNLAVGDYLYLVRAAFPGLIIQSDTIVIHVVPAASVDIFVTANGRNDSTYFVGLSAPSVSSTIINGGGLSYSYQWYDASTSAAVSGATNATFTPSLPPAPTSYHTFVRISANGYTVASDTVTLHIVPAPTANAYVAPNLNQNDSSDFRSVSPPTLSVAVTGNIGYTRAYQWYGPNSTTPIGGATNETYAIASGLNPGVYTYFSRVTLGGITIASDTIHITILPDPVLSAYISPMTSKRDSTYVHGQATIVLASQLSYNAGLTPSYQWVDATSGTSLSSATNTTYLVPTNLSVGEHRYYLRAVFPGLSIQSDTVTLHVLPAVSVDINVAANGRNDSTYFSGVAAPGLMSTISNGGGLNYTYQWCGPNSVNAINGATNSSYTPSSSLSPGTYTFVLRISSGNITVLSDTIMLTVADPPTANAYVSPNIAQNDSSTFRSVTPPTLAVQITGNIGYALSYQWYGPNSSMPISGATNNTYDLTTGLSPGVYRFFSRVALGGLVVSSDTVTITILADPVVTAHVHPVTTKKDSSYVQGLTPPTLGSVLSNNAARTPSYQWYNALTSAALSGASTSTYVLPTTLAVGEHHYYVRATFPGLNVNSDTVHITVLTQPTVHIWIGSSEQNVSTVLCQGQTAPTLHAALSGGSGTTTYQWKQNGVPISGATSLNYTLADNLSPGQYSYTITVTTSGTTISSNSVSVTVFAPPSPTIQVQSGSTSYCEGPSATALLLCPNSFAHYQWIVDGSAIDAATNQSFTVPLGLSAGTHSVGISVTDTNGCEAQTSNSNIVSIHVFALPTPQVSLLSGQLRYCVGSSIDAVLTTQGGFASYQWKLNGTTINGATGSTYSLSSGMSVGTYQYSVVVSDTLGCTAGSMNPLVISIGSTPSITLSQAMQTQCVGYTTSTMISAAVSGCSAEPSYQWTLNGAVITGATGTTCTVPSGLGVGTYQVGLSVQCGACEVASATSAFTVQAMPTVTITPSTLTLCVGYAPTFTLNAAMGNCVQTPSYQWYLNSSLISGATSSSYTIPAGFEIGSYSYTVAVQCGACSIVSTAAPVQVTSAPTITVTQSVSSVCVGYSTAPVLSAQVSGCNAATTYQWMLNGVNVNGATNAQYALPIGLAIASYHYQLRMSCGSCLIQSGVVNVDVVTMPSASASSTVNAICVGTATSPVLSLTTNNCSNVQAYQWYLNSSVIAGATQSSYSVPVGLGSGVYTYSARVQCGNCTVQSTSTSITVQSMPQLNLSSSSQSLCSGYSSSTSVTATLQNGIAAPTFQWILDGSPLGWATGSVCSIPSGLGVGTHQLLVVVTSGACSLSSSSHTINVVQPPSVSLSASYINVCVGYGALSALTATVTDAGQNPTYQWRLNNVDITGATNSSYSIPQGLSAGSYQYSLRVNTPLCTAVSTAALLVVTAPPTLSVASTTSSLCLGYNTSAILSSTLSSSGTSAVYQWSLNGSEIGGATQSSYTVPVGLAVGTYVYSLNVQVGPCSLTSNTLSLSVQNAAQVSITQSYLELCSGYTSSQQLSSVVSGCSSTPAYQWYHNAAAINGATDAIYTIASGLSVGQHEYSIRVTCGPCITMSSISTVVVRPIPSLSIGTNQSSMCLGSAVRPTLSSTLLYCGSAASYQWTVNGSDIPGATSSSYAVPAGLTAGYYSYVVMAQCGPCSIQSNSQTIVVSAPPTVSISSTTLSVCADYSQSPLLSSSVVGSLGSVVYQWYLNGTAISGATNSTYTVPIGLGVGTYTYDIRVTSGACTVQSSSVSVVVSAPPSVSISSSVQSLCSGYAVAPTLSSVVSGCSAAVSYQWMLNNQIISGATSSTYTMPTGLSVGTYAYRLDLQCGPCTVQSSSISMNVSAQPQISVTPSVQALCAGYSIGAHVSSSVSGAVGTPTYQWQLNNTNIAGATASSYDVPVGLSSGAYVYSLKVTSGPCVVTSSQTTISVISAPTLSISSTTHELCTGYSSAATLTSQLSNCGYSPTYQWYQNTSLIAGATAASYTMQTGLPSGTYVYRVVASCGPCTTTSNSDTVRVVAMPTLSVTATSQALCEGYGGTNQLSSTLAGSSSTATYQWMLNAMPIAGATNSTYAMPTGLATGSYSYTLSVSCGACTLTSASSTVVVSSAPTVSISSTLQSLCVGYSTSPQLSSSTLGCTASASYQWSLNGTAIAGATNSTYTMPQGFAAGNYSYTLTISCGPCSLTSSSLSISISNPPSVTLSPSSQTLCGGYSSTTTLSSSISGCGTNSTLQWRRNGSAISGATSSSYTIPIGLGAGTYSYSLMVNCGACSVVSNSVTFTVASPHTISITGNTTELCLGYSTGSTLSSSVSGCGGTPNYQWRLNDVAITGATQSTYTMPNGLAAGSYSYTLVANYGPCVAISNTVVVNVNTPPTVTLSPSQQSLCLGYSYSQTLSLSVTGCNSSASYQWKKDGSLISGATNASLTVPASMAVGVYSFAAVVSCGGCSVTSNPVSVSVIAQPTVSVGVSSGQTNVCSGYSGSSTTLQATASSCSMSSGYQWMVNGNDITGATSDQYSIPSGYSVGTYSFSVRLACGPCTVYAGNSVTFTVGTMPNPTISASVTSFCSGSSSPAMLAVGGGPYTSYQWKLNGVAIMGATSSSYTLPSNLNPGTYPYTVTVTSANCSATSSPSTITVVNGASATISSSATSLCSGGSAAIVFSLVSGNATNWTLVYSASSQQYTVNNINGSSYAISVSPVTNTTYSIVSVSAGGCSSIGGGSVNLTVNQAPSAQTIGSTDGAPSSACYGSTKIYSVPSNVSGNTYQWSFSASTNGISASQLSNTQYSVTYPQTGNGSYNVSISLTETSANGCQRVNSIVTTVQSPATIIAPTISSASICSGSTAQVSIVAPQSGMSYRLTLGSTQIGSIITAPANVSWPVTPTSSGSYIYSVTALSATACTTAMGSVTLTVNSAPTVSLSASSTSICPGSTASVSFNFTGQAPWTLVYKIGSGSNTSITTSSNPYTVTQTLSASTVFSVISVSNASCTGSVSGSSAVSVTVLGIPLQSCVMAFAADDATANANSKVTFWDNYAGSGTSYPDGYVNTTSDSYRPQKYPNYSALNNHAGVYFDGNDESVTVTPNTASGISGGAQKSWYMLYRPASSALPTTRMVIYKQGDENHGFCIYLINRVVYYGVWNNQNCAGSCSNKWAVFHNTGFTVVPGNNYILQLVYNGNAASTNRLRFAINGTMYTPSSAPGTSMDYSGDVVSFGGKVGNTRFHDGPSTNECNEYNLGSSKIAEVLLYNSCDVTLRNTVWCVLKSKYGFTSIGDNPIGVLAKGADDDEIIRGERVSLQPRYDLSETRPNPAIDYALFTLTVETQQHVRVTVLNEIGQPLAVVFSGMLARQSPNGFTVDATTLPSGTYILHVEGEDFVVNRTFVVVH